MIFKRLKIKLIVFHLIAATITFQHLRIMITTR